MSVATEFPPVVDIPERARRTQSRPQSGPQSRPQRPPVPGTAGRLATVTTLQRPMAQSAPVPPARLAAAPLRLTRRGVCAIAAAVGVLALGLVWVAWLSAPSAVPTHRIVPDTVTVRAGDTLWSLAGRLAPDRDPGAEVAELQRLNGLRGVALVPGQVLRTH